MNKTVKQGNGQPERIACTITSFDKAGCGSE